MTTTSASLQLSVSELLSLAEKYKYNNREKSFTFAQQALTIAEDSENKKDLVQALLLAAYSYHHRALHELFFKSIDRVFDLLSDGNDDKSLSYAYYLCGCCFRNLGDYSSSAENFIKGLMLAEEDGDIENTIRIHNGLGHLYNILGDNTKSLNSLTRGLDMIPHYPDLHLHANLLGNQAEVFIELKRFDEAKANLQYVASIYADLNDLAGSGVTNLRLGKLHYAIGEVDQCISILTKLYEKAYENDFKIGITIVGGDFGRILIDLGRIEEAIPLVEKAIEVSKEINYQNNQYDLFYLKYRIAVWQKDYKCALHYYELYHELKEKTYIREAEIKLKNAESLTEIQLVKKEAELNRLKHVELRKAYEEIEVKNKEITDSIRYARRIQAAFLPSEEMIGKSFPDFFVFFQPRNIVSGDFYWFRKCINNDHSLKLMAVADCTGHGVPGAMMSMIGSSLLNQIVIAKGIFEPSKILEELDRDLCYALKTNGSDARDGMDISIAMLDEKTNELHIASAMRPSFVYLSGKNELIDVPATKRSIGGSFECSHPISFKTTILQLEMKDRIYMFSDGFADQFGGPKGKKLMVKNFKSLIKSTAQQPVNVQSQKISEFFDSWKGTHEQVDDVTLMCIEVK